MLTSEMLQCPAGLIFTRYWPFKIIAGMLLQGLTWWWPQHLSSGNKILIHGFLLNSNISNQNMCSFNFIFNKQSKVWQIFNTFLNFTKVCTPLLAVIKRSYRGDESLYISPASFVLHPRNWPENGLCVELSSPGSRTSTTRGPSSRCTWASDV